MTFTSGVLRAGDLNSPIGSIRSEIKTTDFTLNNVQTLSNDPELWIPIPAQQFWAIEGYLIYLVTPAADAQFRLSVPSGASGDICYGGLETTAVQSGGKNARARLTIDGTTQIGGVSSVATLYCPVFGVIRTASTPGQVGVQFSQWGVDATNATLYAGSWMMLTRVG